MLHRPESSSLSYVWFTFIIFSCCWTLSAFNFVDSWSVVKLVLLLFVLDFFSSPLFFRSNTIFSEILVPTLRLFELLLLIFRLLLLLLLIFNLLISFCTFWTGSASEICKKRRKKSLKPQNFTKIPVTHIVQSIFYAGWVREHVFESLRCRKCSDYIYWWDWFLFYYKIV